MKETKYVIDSGGKYWLPPFKSRMEGWARYNWFRKKMQAEGHTASKESWEELEKEYEVHVLKEDEIK